MISIRFYIITIAIIFVSLGTGILIGLNMNGQDIYLKQQQLLIEGFENKYNQMAEEKENFLSQIELLLQENDNSIKLIDYIINDFTNNKLMGLNIAIIKTSKGYNYHDITEFLEDAGASVAFDIVYNENLLALYNDPIDIINIYQGFEVTSYGQLIDAINKDIINLFIYGNISQLLEVAINNNHLLCEIDYEALLSKPLHYVIITGGASEIDEYQIEVIDMALIDLLRRNVIPVVGVEGHDVANSYIPFYKRAEISTIDNVNTVMGKISLINVLTGQEGNYGDKETNSFID